MAKQIESFRYVTESIQEGDIFPSFAKLFQAVTGRKPPTGKRNLDIVKANLSRYLEYRKQCEVDKLCTKKNAVIVKKIYSTPLSKEIDGRGKHGKYVDLLRPLLLNLHSFEGKYTTLANHLGLFSKYFTEIKFRSPDIAEQLERQSDSQDFNLWRHNKHTSAGEREYKAVISLKLREILKGALQSLQKDGIVNLQEVYAIVPDKDVVMEDFTIRPRSKVEEYEEWEICGKAIEEEASRKGAVLNPELAKHLILGYDYLQSLMWSITPYDGPVEATPEQAEAIENYQRYVRQCVVKEYKGLAELPVVEDYPLITNVGLFFQNPKLVQLYNNVDEKLRPTLFGDVKFWKEIRYEVVDDNKAARYWPQEGFHSEQAADQVSQEILSYMDGQLKKKRLETGPDDLDDVHLALGTPKAGREYILKNYASAVRFHEMLKKLYEGDI